MSALKNFKGLFIIPFMFIAVILSGQNCSLTVTNVSAPTELGGGNCSYIITLDFTTSNDNGNANNSVTFIATNGTITGQSVWTGCNPCSTSYDLTIETTCSATVSITADYDGPGASDCTTVPIDVPTTTLPVTFSTLNIKQEGDGIRVLWETNYELSNVGFEVEQSTNASFFNSVGYVHASEGAENGATYSFFVSDLDFGVNYFRIKQIDQNGTFAYSDKISIDFKKAQSHLQVYPNPVSNERRLTVKGGENTDLKIISLTGQILLSKSMTAHKETIQLGGLKSGLYILLNIKEGKTINRRQISVL